LIKKGIIIQNSNSNTYHSFLLRLWLVKAAKGYAWRASVEQVDSGALKGFANLDELMFYLLQLTNKAQDVKVKEESNET
jgi:hypothetical protein